MFRVPFLQIADVIVPKKPNVSRESAALSMGMFREGGADLGHGDAAMPTNQVKKETTT